MRAIAVSAGVRDLVEPVLGAGCFPVRGILFDKVPDANWVVPWHQDVTIAVERACEASGFGPWSVKAGVHHVAAPAWVLERMLSVRLHLDDCGAENGALRVLPGTHRLGRLASHEVDRVRCAHRERVCAIGRGGILLIRPLLLHASSPSHAPLHRRVIHLDFASAALPFPLRWRDQALVDRNVEDERQHQ